MKIYEGGRSLDGSTVTVDGKPLPPRHDLLRISKTGFEWGVVRRNIGPPGAVAFF